MVVTWDKSSNRIWFGKWGCDPSSIDLYLVVEQLPASNDWDWAVWEAGDAKILRRGVAASAQSAADAAESAARDQRSKGYDPDGVC
jgi:hypothetical protein